VPVRTATTTQPTQPIAARTRAKLRNSNHFAALATAWPDEDDAMHQHFSGPVLDAETGTELEHRQLRKHPTYKKVWDESYANELGRLCQGIGTLFLDKMR